LLSSLKTLDFFGTLDLGYDKTFYGFSEIIFFGGSKGAAGPFD
jgi:hypothetical protein